MKETIWSVIMGKKQYKGFILLQTLLAFSLFLILISIIPLIVQSVSYSDDGTIHSLEVQIFFQQLSFEIRQGKEIRVEQGRLILINRHDEEVMIEKYQDKIRRRVQLAGHEIMLQQVKKFEVQIVNHGVYVHIVDTYGNEYEHRISRAHSLVG